MPSISHQHWATTRRAALDELEHAHRLVGGKGPGRRYATHQLNQAYAVMLSGQFQGFCRELYTECVAHFLVNVPIVSLQKSFHTLLTQNLKLNTGNPNPGNIGNDYNKFSIYFWDEVQKLHRRNESYLVAIEEMNGWRNAIAHQDFDPAKLKSRTVLRLRQVQYWRNACTKLALAFDDVMRSHLHQVNGIYPW